MSMEFVTVEHNPIIDNEMMTGSPREIDVIHQIWLYLCRFPRLP